jgi:hypothetical protein
LEKRYKLHVPLVTFVYLFPVSWTVDEYALGFIVPLNIDYASVSFPVRLLFSSRRLISTTAADRGIPSTIAHSWQSTACVASKKAVIVP